MMVLDQTLPNNSYLSFINTNLYIPNQNYISNVTATDFIIRDKANRHALTSIGSISQIDDNSYELGYKHNLVLHKISGNFLYNAWSNTENKTYNPNDLGYLQRANKFSNGGSMGYRIYKPFWNLFNWSSWIGASCTTLFEPMVYNSSTIWGNIRTTFARTYHSVGLDFWLDPRETHDYYEPRVEGGMVIIPHSFSGGIWTSSDYRRPLAIDIRAGYWRTESMDMSNYYMSFSPRIRFSDNFLLIYQIRQDYGRNSIGYVGRTNDNSTIYMGLRDVSTLTNSLNGLYAFSANSFLNLNLRHYWRWLDYSSYHTLNHDGTLAAQIEQNGIDKNINYNLFNIDLTYQWNFAPGSVLSVVWKNSIEVDNSNVRSKYFTNLGSLLESGQANSISLRMLYYIDFNTLMKGRI